MALPTLQKVWSVSPNNRIPFVSLNDTMASLLFGIKNYLVATAGWSVWFSSNGTTGPTSGTDHTDRWLSKANCTTRFNGTNGAQSYIVLVNGDGAHILLSYNGSSDDIATIRYSPGGIYALQGTTTFEPTATDEVIVSTGTSVINATASADRVWHLWTSSDKKMLRVAVFRAVAIASVFGVEGITSAVVAPSTHTPPMYGFFYTNVQFGTTNGQPHYQVSGAVGGANYLGASARVFASGVSQILQVFGGSLQFANAIPPFTAERPELQGGAGELLWPLLKGTATATAQGVLGTTLDWWVGAAGSANTPALGDFFGNLQFVALGSACVWPWDGATPVFWTA